MCLAKGVGFMPAEMSGSGPMGESMGLFVHLIGAPLDAGIMKVTAYDERQGAVDMEVTKVDRRTLSASDFQAPAGYKPFQMPRH